MHTHEHAQAHARAHTHTHTRARTRTRTRTHAHTHTRTHNNTDDLSHVNAQNVPMIDDCRQFLTVIYDPPNQSEAESEKALNFLFPSKSTIPK